MTNTFIVSDEGYGKKNTFSLLVENNKKFEKFKTFDFADMATNESIDIVASYAYGEYILMRTNNKIYMTSISDIKTELNIL